MILKSKSDLKGHSRALAMMPMDRPHTVSYYCSIATMYLLYLAPFPRYYRVFSKIERGHVTQNTSLSGVIYHACTRTPLLQSAHGICSAASQITKI